MTFDNSKMIISLRIKLFMAIVALIAFFILTYIAKILKFPILGMNETFWLLIVVGINLFIAFLPMVLNYQYIYFSDNDEKIIIRYFMAGIAGGRKNSVEIDKRSFSGYKTEKRFFGLIHSLILFQKFREGEAKYPTIYISALTKDERNKIFRALNSYLQPS